MFSSTRINPNVDIIIPSYHLTAFNSRFKTVNANKLLSQPKGPFYAKPISNNLSFDNDFDHHLSMKNLSPIKNLSEQQRFKDDFDKKIIQQDNILTVKPLQKKPTLLKPFNYYQHQESLKTNANTNKIISEKPNLTHSLRKGTIQQIIPFDASPSKVNHLLLKHLKQTNSSNYQNSNTRKEKKQLHQLDQDQNEQMRIKESLKIHSINDHIQDQLVDKSIRRQKQNVDGLFQNHNQQKLNQTNEIQSKYLPQHTFSPFQSQLSKPIHSTNSQFEHHGNSSSTDSMYFNIKSKNSNAFLQSQSPTSWTINLNKKTSDNYESSSSNPNLSINDKLNRTCRLSTINENQPLLNKYVNATSNSQLCSHAPHPSPIYSRQTFSFSCISDYNDMNNKVANNSSNKLPLLNHQKFLSSSHDRFTSCDKITFPFEKANVSNEEDDTSTNYDSDDGWSHDSAELLYVDERYLRQNKKI